MRQGLSGSPKNCLLLAALLSSLILSGYCCWLSLWRYFINFGQYYDDALYMVCSFALSEGQGYRIISIPGEPSQTKYPIGYALLLALLWRLFPNFPQNLPAFESVQLIVSFAAVLVGTGYFWRTRKVTFALAVAICASSILNRRFIDLAPMILTDLPCTLMSMIALWRTEVEAKRVFKIGSALLLGVLVVAPGLVRLHGLAVLLCCLIYLLLKKKRRLAGVVLICAVVTLAPYFFWRADQRSLAPQFLSYYTGYVYASDAKLPPLSELWPLMNAGYAWNGFIQVQTYFPYSFESFTRLLPKDAVIMLWPLIYIPGVALPFLGMLLEARRGVLLGLYACIYLAPGLIFPRAFEWRHFVPIMPMGYYYYVRACRWLARKFKPQARVVRKLYQPVCGAVAVVFGLYIMVAPAVQSIVRERDLKLARWPMPPYFSPQFPKSDYDEAFRWLAARTRLSDTLVCNNDPLCFLYTGRQALFPFKVDGWMNLVEVPVNLTEVLYFAAPRYMVADPLFPGRGLPATPVDWSAMNLNIACPGLVKLVFASSHKLIRVYAIDYSKMPKGEESVVTKPQKVEGLPPN